MEKRGIWQAVPSDQEAGSRSCAASTQLESGVAGDAELISSARSGDTAAIGALYERHAGAAWVVARQYSDSPTDADDVVADAFTAVFGAIQRGKGPESAFRAYLFTVVRRVAGLRREKNRRVQPTDDIAVLEAGTALAGTAEEPALAGFERGVVARAFHSLPERWQAVLWHTEVEGLTPAEIAPILGLTANGVAALAYRAREGLRQAYLQQHLQDPLDDGCRPSPASSAPTSAAGWARARPARSRRTSRTAGPVVGCCSSWATSTTACVPSSRPWSSDCSGSARSGWRCRSVAGWRPAPQPLLPPVQAVQAVPARAAWRPVARPQRVPRRRPGPSVQSVQPVQSVPAPLAVRSLPVAWRPSWPRSRWGSPQRSWAASRSPRSRRSPS